MLGPTKIHCATLRSSRPLRWSARPEARAVDEIVTIALATSPIIHLYSTPVSICFSGLIPVLRSSALNALLVDSRFQPFPDSFRLRLAEKIV